MANPQGKSKKADKCFYCGEKKLPSEKRCLNCLMLCKPVGTINSKLLIKQIALIFFGGGVAVMIASWIPLVGGILSSLLGVATWVGIIFVIVKHIKNKNG